MKRRSVFVLLIVMTLGVVGYSFNAEFETRSNNLISRGTIAFEDAFFAATDAINGQVALAEFKAKAGVPIYGFKIISSDDSAWNVGIHGNTGLVIGIEKHVAPNDSEFASQSDVSADEAQEIALRFMPGTIAGSDYLFHSAGHAFYQFAVNSNIGGIFNFEINAQTGEIQAMSQVLWQVGGALTGPAIQGELSLYDRLGGLEAITAVVSNFAQRLFDDPELEPFFGSLNEQRQQRFIDLNVDFLCQAADGPCTYTGRSMFDAHNGMGTSNDIFNIVFQHLIDTLTEFNVPEEERREILSLIETTRDDIVEE